jgi:glycosyltransferase involved in cell wall biosynthesis
MKISIVIISYNQGEFLEETILSVLNQTYINTEVILIDGGSSDNSIDIINKYKDEFSYWVSEKDNGQSDAIIKGFNKSSGDIITWINSDDLLSLNAAKTVAELAEKNKTSNAVFYGDGLIIDENGKIHEKLKYGRFNYFVAKTLGPTISQPGTFFSKEVYKELGGIDVSLHYGMDLDLFNNFLFNNIPFYYTGIYMAKFRKYSTQKGHTEKYLEICIYETVIIQNRYGFNKLSLIQKRKARLIQIFQRIWNGYYFILLSFRLFYRGRLKEYNPNYSS